MAIFIGNYRVAPPRTNIPSFDCTRRSPLGNPYMMNHESERDRVCDAYVEWFKRQIVGDSSPAFQDALAVLERNAKGGDIELMCWCAPKRCHCETIKQHLEGHI